MKYLVFVFILINSLSMMAKDLIINIENPKELITKQLDDFWKTIPTNFEFKNISLAPISPNISAKLEKAILITTQSPKKLFDFSIKGANSFSLQWKLNELKLNSLIKIRFKFKMYGIKITHDEYFIVKASNIKDANTSLDFSYNEYKIKFTEVRNYNFKLNNIKIKPKNGIGNVLKFIFENVLSRRKVEMYISSQVNELLDDWINQNEFITQLENNINDKLEKFEKTPIAISEHGPKLKLTPSFFEFNHHSLLLKIQSEVLLNSKKHICARDINQKSDLQLSKRSIESLINYFSIYEQWNGDILSEPLLCLGYKEFDEHGRPMGEDAQFKAIGKTIKFKYWVTPNSLPVIEYNKQQQSMDLNVDLKLEIYNNQYPLIKVTNGYLNIKAILSFYFEFNTNDGLFLKFKSLSINNLIGNLKAKPFKFSPWIPLPMNTIKNQLENGLNKSIGEDKEISHLLKSNIKISESIFLIIKDFSIQDKYFYFNFDF